MLEYLRLGQLGYIFAGRTLFVHGGVSPANMGTVPGQKSIEHDPHTWWVLFETAILSTVCENAR